MQVWNHQKMDKSSLWHQTKVRGWLRFESELTQRHDEEKMQVNTRQDNVKIVNSCGPHFGVSSEKGSHTRHKLVKAKLENKHVRTTTENQKENSRSVSAIFSSL